MSLSANSSSSFDRSLDSRAAVADPDPAPAPTPVPTPDPGDDGARPLPCIMLVVDIVAKWQSGKVARRVIDA